MPSELDTFSSLHKRLLAIDLSSSALAKASIPPEKNADREPWGSAKHREVTDIMIRVIALLEIQDRLQAIPLEQRFAYLRTDCLGRTDVKFRMTPKAAARCSTKQALVDRYLSCRDSLASLIAGMAQSFPSAVLKVKVKKSASSQKAWMEIGLPASLENFALTLEEFEGEATAKQLKENICLAPADVLAKCKPQWSEWIDKHIKRPRRGVYRLE